MSRLVAIIAVIFLTACISLPAAAITWVDTKVDDPYSNKVCKVHEPASFGSYIYSYPSKWDGVYWPYTDENWLWTCPSGYVGFGDDVAFENDGKDIPETERNAVTSYLASHTKAPKTADEKFNRLSDLEALKQKSASERAFQARLEAYWKNDNARREAAIPLQEEALSEVSDSQERMQLTFVLGVYNEVSGHADLADEWFTRTRETPWTDAEGKEQVGSPYLNSLIDEFLEARRPTANTPPE